MNVYNYDGMNYVTHDLLVEDIDIKEKDDIDLLYETYLIGIDTLFPTPLHIMEKLVLLKSRNLPLSTFRKSKKKKWKVLSYRGAETEYKKLSDCMKLNVDTFDLLTRKRQQKCHMQSMILCYHIPNTRIVTGYIRGNHCRIIHSIVVEEKDGIEYALDWTKNVVMKYEDYKRIHNFDIITEIERDKVVDDLDNNVIGYGLNSKIYCLFRDELMRDIERQNNVLRKSK